MPSVDEKFPPRDTAAYRRILAAAEESFGTLGFQKTSVVEIADAAQVSKPLVYRYFESKEHLYEVVVRRLVESWNEELVVELSRSKEDGVAEALRGMHRSSLEFARRSPVLRGILANERRLLLASYSNVIGRIVGTLRGQIAECLQAGVDRDEVRLDLPVATMADAVTEIHVGYVARIVSGTEKPNAERSALDAFECLLFGICTSEPGRTTQPTKAARQRRKRSR